MRKLIKPLLLYKITMMALSLVLFSCGSDAEDTAGSSSEQIIKGKVSVIGTGASPDAVKITLTNSQKPGDVHVVMSRNKGIFELVGIEPGEYYFDATKDGYRAWAIVVNDKEVVHNGSVNKTVKIVAGKITNITIMMVADVYITLKYLDLNGKAFNNLKVKKGAKTVSFQMFNDTGVTLNWEINYRNFLCSTTIYNADSHTYTQDVVNCISSVSPSRGQLLPGESIPVVCQIDPKTYSYDIVMFGPLTIDYTGEYGIFNHQEIGMVLED